MSKANGKKPRLFSADEKLKILAEARQRSTTVAEVLRRHQGDGATFYRWEWEAKSAIRHALGGRPRGGDAHDTADLAARVLATEERLHAVLGTDPETGW